MRTARSGTATPKDTSNGDRLTKCAGRRKPRADPCYYVDCRDGYAIDDQATRDQKIS
jgi:hypothetical protein